MEKGIKYLRFWLFAMCFTVFWVIYGCFVFIKNLVVENNFDMQAVYLILGMLILFFQSNKEFKKLKR
ncbi:hypothetical protein [Saliterribacillus persicus]|uniref:Uncharacterized protein n=1 Tax=Saliterribacillus persicus TaxID=930114 RepID=A0A368XRN1_9BACI|nr:hypothetical protein [Saliterribacillus persicus]RCW69698.1 hypothetical protein DFR57_10786 [Saliterribacillus persicus]